MTQMVVPENALTISKKGIALIPPKKPNPTRRGVSSRDSSSSARGKESSKSDLEKHLDEQEKAASFAPCVDYAKREVKKKIDSGEIVKESQVTQAYEENYRRCISGLCRQTIDTAKALSRTPPRMTVVDASLAYEYLNKLTFSDFYGSPTEFVGRFS